MTAKIQSVRERLEGLLKTVKSTGIDANRTTPTRAIELLGEWYGFKAEFDENGECEKTEWYKTTEGAEDILGCYRYIVKLVI